jgi:hypothetical protein
VSEIVRFISDTNSNIRWRAIYGERLRRAARPAGGPVSAALVDKLPLARAMAARALNRTWADSGGLDRNAVAGLLARALADDDAGVRTNASARSPASAATVLEAGSTPPE